MSEKLIPCPICGSENTVRLPYNDRADIERCKNCNLTIIVPFGYTMWNTRPIEDELRKRIAELGLELGRKSVELGELVGRNILWEVINDELKSRRENLERENDRLQEKVSDLLKRIAELEGENKKAFDFVKTLRTYCIYAHWDNPDTEGEFNEFDAEICKWLSEFTERER